MAQAGAIVFQKREAFIWEFIPIFQSFYSFISQDKEVVGLSYESHARDASLLEVLKQSRKRDKIMGFSLRGIHKDELNMLLGEFPIKKEGSQGQNKTYLVALKLAQFDFFGYDGLLVSHGNQDGSYVFLKEITEQYPDMKIVTFDTQFYSDGEYQKLPGVTQMFQQDKSLVTVLLDQMIEKYGEGVRLIKVWRGPNYNSPFDRREVGWQEYEAAGKIVTVGEVQPLQDSVDSANTVTAAYLQGVNRADVDGVIAYYDLYGQGVYNAIAENDNFNGKNGDALPMASVDIDPVDVTNMQTRPDIWTAAGTTDWTMNGEIGMRILMLELADQYDKIFDPATGESGVDVVEVPGTAIKADALKSDSTVENLGNIAGETYGNLDYLSAADWMPKDLIHK